LLTFFCEKYLFCLFNIPKPRNFYGFCIILSPTKSRYTFRDSLQTCLFHFSNHSQKLRHRIFTKPTIPLHYLLCACVCPPIMTSSSPYRTRYTLFRKKKVFLWKTLCLKILLFYHHVIASHSFFHTFCVCIFEISKPLTTAGCARSPTSQPESAAH
jgi:hypothetical protein